LLAAVLLTTLPCISALGQKSADLTGVI